MNQQKHAWLSAGTLEQLRAEGSKVIKGGIAVFAHEDGAAAIDNRCPHLGFPLHLGSVCNGILTCHWHNARFDVCSGGTLDPWADDAMAHDVLIENGEVWVNPSPRQKLTVDRLMQRLREGLEQNIGIVIAKAVVGLIEADVAEDEIVRVGVAFGTAQQGGWTSGLTILSAMRNVLPRLDKMGRILALYHGLVHVARAGSGSAPRRLLSPLPSVGLSAERLAQWYRDTVEVRDTQGAEKVLLTALDADVPLTRLAEMMLIGVTDHFYLDGGHTFDFHNKAFEMLDALGGESAVSVLTSLTPMMRNPTRSEELHHWQAPIDLVKPLREAFELLTADQETHTGEKERSESEPDTHNWMFNEASFLAQLLSDRPLETIEQITTALRGGESPATLARLIALAAAERVARFHTQNEFSDWFAVLHTFTYAHAVHERLLVSEEPLLQRALYYGAVSIYHDRFLNVPRAPKPRMESYATQAEIPKPDHLLTLLEQRQQVEEAASFTASYLQADGPIEPLLNVLGHCLLREDAEFHSFQMYEAALAEYDHWSKLEGDFATQAAHTMLIACVRYLAAHAPTARELPHTVGIAWRLSKGERLFEEE